MEKKAVGKGMKSQKQAYLFLAPSLIILTVFVFVPLVGAIAISIMNINIYMNDISFAGLKNYLRMFSDVRVGNATLNTFYFALLEVPLQILLALLLVMFMTKKYEMAQADAHDVLSAVCLLDDGGQHHVVDAAQQKLWNASVSAWQDRDSDARPFNEHNLGDANRHFCDGMERIWLYPDGAVRGGTRRFQFSL